MSAHKSIHQIRNSNCYARAAVGVNKSMFGPAFDPNSFIAITRVADSTVTTPKPTTKPAAGTAACKSFAAEKRALLKILHLRRLLCAFKTIFTPRVLASAKDLLTT